MPNVLSHRQHRCPGLLLVLQGRATDVQECGGREEHSLGGCGSDHHHLVFRLDPLKAIVGGSKARGGDGDL